MPLEPDTAQTGSMAASVGLPLAAMYAAPAALGKHMVEAEDPWNPGAKMPLFRPVYDATKRVEEGRGTAEDFMMAYRNPGQVQHTLPYQLGHLYGPGMVQGAQGVSRGVLSGGMLPGLLKGGLGAAGLGIILNGLKALTGKADFAPGASALQWGKWGGLLGALGGGYTQWRKNQFLKGAAWRSPDNNGQEVISQVLAQLRQAPGLSFYERGQLMAGVGKLPPASAARLRDMIAMSGGASIGAMVSKFLMGQGLVGQVAGAVLGGSIGRAFFGSGDRWSSTGFDMSGRPF